MSFTQISLSELNQQTIRSDTPLSFDEWLDYTAKGKAGGQKECTPGKSYPCKSICLGVAKNCRNPLEGQAKNYSDWLTLQGQKVATASPKKPKASKAQTPTTNGVTKVTQTPAATPAKTPKSNNKPANKASSLEDDGLPTTEALSNAKAQSLGATSYNGDLISKAKIGGKEYFLKGMLEGDKAVNNEVAVSKLAKIAGLDAHFLAVKGFKRKDGKSAIATEFVKGKDIRDMVPREAMKAVPDKKKEELLAFDYLIGSQDRNPANVFVGDKGEVLLIDNEFSFKNKSDNYSDFAEAYNVVAAARFIQDDDKLKPNKDFIKSIDLKRDEIIKELESRNIDPTGFTNRLNKMKSGATWKELLGEEQWNSLPTTRDIKKQKAELKRKQDEFNAMIAQAKARAAKPAAPAITNNSDLTSILSPEQIAKLRASLS